ncbi:ArsR/SmtB family transcription factor [Anoxynatronum buryatiense]|uniref:ArsR/SmtB family transcription factor n=1 Tax=Anoxynatronum buryatiense TaxID=489973 RepID=UPI0024B80E87|nr:metalloregulator ArsR/SmtB family transcription factor [Anoxynatronum buryatiense]
MIIIPELFEILKSLSDETRYHLIKLLLRHDYCVGALAHHLGVSESAVSQHLKILRNAGIVKGDKRGYFTHYYVDRHLLKQAAKELNELADLAQGLSECHQSASSKHSCCKKTGITKDRPGEDHHQKSFMTDETNL